MKVSIIKHLTLAGILAGVMAFAGCGGGDNLFSSTPVVTVPTATTTPTTVTAIATVPSATAPAATVTTTAPVTASSSVSPKASIAIPSGTVITPPAGTVFTSAPVINVSTPAASTVAFLPAPATTGFTVSSAAGAVDVTVAGFSSITFSSPVTISIPVDTNVTPVGTTVEISKNKNDGKGYVSLGKSVVQGAAGSGYATIATSDLCFFCVDCVFTSTTGSTGSAGAGNNF